MRDYSRHIQLCLCILGIAALVSGCGGGDSSASGPISSSLSFQLQSGYKNLIRNGYSKSFTVSGTCNGSGTKLSAPANTSSTFENVTGFSATETLTMTLTNCTPASSTQAYTDYYDTNYVPLGFVTAGVNYGVWSSPPSIPATVTVGATGVIGTQNYYTDNSKTTGDGHEDASYVVEPETATTAIVNLISNYYDASGALSATEQDRYRIDAVGTLTPDSINIQYVKGSTSHLVLTF